MQSTVQNTATGERGDRPIYVSIDTLASGTTAEWSDVADRVVVKVGADASIRLSPGQALALADQLRGAVDAAEGHWLLRNAYGGESS